MAGKEGDKKPPAAPPAPAAPKKSAESSFDLGAVKPAPARKPGPPVPTGKTGVAQARPPGIARPRPFDTLDSEDTVPGAARLPSLSDMRKITGSTTPDLKPVPEKMLTPFTSAQPVLVRPPNVFQKQLQSSGFDDDEKTNTDALLGNFTGPKLDADEEDEITVTTALHDGLLPAREVTSVDTWKAVNAPMTSKQGRRTAVLYQNVIEQFACGYNQRYQVDASGKSKTHIFVWDVTRAMGCEVPHFVGGRETTLGQMVDWLRFEGHTRGWKKANAAQAIEAADRGEAVLAVPQEGKLRMLAVVRPGGADAQGMPRVAAAIDEVGNDMPATDALKTPLIAYYVHE
ncbi:MAG: Muramidase (flagellum-specific) [Myxococcaceae bacterium]|nr:Muramidase (flagellum-specific) [Myxococcaceae bacterium]